MSKIFVGFGFGPILSGLFLCEAYRSGKFDRLVVAEVRESIVDAVCQARGTCAINIASNHGTTVHIVEGVEILNPQDPLDRVRLVTATAECDEVATALPSVEFHDRGHPNPASLLGAGFLQRKASSSSQKTLVYAADNHSQAAQILSEKVRLNFHDKRLAWLGEHTQFANTVIGKMSGVVDDQAEIAHARLQPVVEGTSPEESQSLRRSQI